MKSVAILGTVGVPANYGGFETLAEHLVLQNAQLVNPHKLSVYCSEKSYNRKLSEYHGARLHYLPFNANGMQSLLYDMWSLVDAVLRGADVVLLLGHGGSFIIPSLKLITKTKFITNIDGVEWRREKWSGLARWVLRKSESFAVRHSHIVIADNNAIQEYVFDEYKKTCEIIPYGGDHALATEGDLNGFSGLPDTYALALCRIVPENNVTMILDAFDERVTPLVFVGNWDNSDYGRELKTRYSAHSTIIILDPVYAPQTLRAIRDRANMYIHGHSAGGTNPSLVEMMHFGIPIFSFDCIFNRYTTENKGIYFNSSAELLQLINDNDCGIVGDSMKEIACRRYTWDQVAAAYFKLFI